MKRPFYVYTPHNRYGENLVSPHNSICYEIKSVYTGARVHAKIKDRREAEDEAKRLNDAHETEMAYAMYI